MRVLVACEYSGVVRDAFIRKGHEAVSCDLLNPERPGPFYQGDVFDIINDGWDLMIAHPPCTFLTNTASRWLYDDRYPNRKKDREEAAKFFVALYNAPIKKVAVENPVGYMSSYFRPPDQYVHPYFFGDPVSKKTGLWLKSLPLLKPTDIVEPKRSKTKSGREWDSWFLESSSLPVGDRMKFRSRTFEGLANAMAEQWG